MKKLLSIIVGILLFPSVIFAATFSGVENFDSYTGGANLATLNGGSGWGTAWVLDYGTNTIIKTDQFVSSANSGGLTLTSGNSGMGRDATTPPSGASTIIHASIRLASTVTGGNNSITFGTQLSDGTGFYIGFLDDAGNYKVQSRLGSTVTVATGLLLDTWYHAWIDFDVTNLKIRGYISTTIPYASVTWSAYTAAGQNVSFARFMFQPQENDAAATTMTGWIDDVRDGAADFVALPASNPLVDFIFFWW